VDHVIPSSTHGATYARRRLRFRAARRRWWPGRGCAPPFYGELSDAARPDGHAEVLELSLGFGEQVVGILASVATCDRLVVIHDRADRQLTVCESLAGALERGRRVIVTAWNGGQTRGREVIGGHGTGADRCRSSNGCVGPRPTRSEMPHVGVPPDMAGQARRPYRKPKAPGRHVT
jgi:hypothetical protein